MDIGKSIKRARIINGSNQMKFAGKIGIAQSYLSSIENNHKKPSLDVLEKVASVTGIPLSILFWFGADRNDVAEDKRIAYDVLMPALNAAIAEIFSN